MSDYWQDSYIERLREETGIDLNSFDLDPVVKGAHGTLAGNSTPNDNWIERTRADGHGQLPDYIIEIAKALMREGKMTKSRAIATAISRVKVWCATSKDPKTKSKACNAVRQWEQLRAKNAIKPRKKD